MLEIKDLKSRIGDTEILRGLSLSVKAGAAISTSRDRPGPASRATL